MTCTNSHPNMKVTKDTTYRKECYITIATVIRLMDSKLIGNLGTNEISLRINEVVV